MITSVENLNERISSCSKCLEDKLSGKDGKRHIVLCGGTGCLSSNSAEIRERFVELLKEKGLDDKATVNQVGCFGFCSQGPFVKIFPEDTLYRMVSIDDVDEIIESTSRTASSLSACCMRIRLHIRRFPSRMKLHSIRSSVVLLFMAAASSILRISMKRSAMVRSRV